jgi:hypothetical protein
MNVPKKSTPEWGKKAPSSGALSSSALPGARTSELLRLAAEPGAYAFYRWENVAINAWASQPTAAAVQVLSELTERSVRECPGGIVSIHWLDEGVALPTADARVGLGALAKRYPKHVLCVGVLLAGSGFWASATRSALTGIMLLAPRSFALRFFGDVGELSAYIVREQAQRGAMAASPEHLVAAIDDALADFKRTLGRS